jgi:predicted RNase H-like HicB family nuclease
MGPEAAGQRKKALEDALKEASEALKQLKEDAKA